MMLGGLAVSQALLVGTPMSRTTRVAAPQMADIMETAAGLTGPVVFWGADGVALGHEESDVRGSDDFGTFVAAVAAAGLTDALKGPGPFTVLMPTDAAFAEFKGELTADLLKYHVIPGKVATGSVGADLETLQGSSLTYRRYVRKTFLDNAIIGVTSAGASKGQNYPVDVACDNGVIHAIDIVLEPGTFSVANL
jgi:uncharacterized surface protein with fasciclin (FAS1) repeats